MEETKTLLNTVLSLQPRVVSAGGGGGKSREEMVLDLISQLSEQVRTAPRLNHTLTDTH